MSLTLRFQTRRELLQQMVPRYRMASALEKGALLDEIATTTGYARRYAMWLLNHLQEGQCSPRRRQHRYGPEVQGALFLAWHAANCICSKRLMPFLPTLIEALERHRHLQLTDACRSQLLSMSAATADRLLHAPRTQSLRGIATTRAGTLLKQQIPVRTFTQWNEAQPGFVEAERARALWGAGRGKLSLHTDPHRYSHWVDRRMCCKNKADLLGWTKKKAKRTCYDRTASFQMASL